jgi:opacity protein-like surface antigen
MSMSSGKSGLVFVLAALCLAGRAAHAQSAPFAYWMPNWPIGFGGSLSAASSANAFGNGPGLDSGDAKGAGFSYARTHFQDGWSGGGEGGSTGLSGALTNIPSLAYDGVQFGYNFKGVGALPVTVYAGFDTLKYNPGIGSPFASDSASNAVTGYGAHAGVEFQPTSNVSLSLGVGYAQQPAGNINSLSLPGASPFAFGARR